MGRTICNAKLAFYRQADGAVAVLEDFFPHRGAPLSLGRVCEGLLMCGYHGLVVVCDGKTVSMPGQRVGGFPAIRAYPAVERYGFVWVWPGDASKADASTIPHQHWHDHLDWAFGGGRHHVKADYRLMVDNLMDLTHETYVHASSIGHCANALAPQPPEHRATGPTNRPPCCARDRRDALQNHHQWRRGAHQLLYAQHSRATVLARRAA